MMTTAIVVCAVVCLLALLERALLFLGKFFAVWKVVTNVCPEEELVDISDVDGEHETFLGLVNVRLRDYQQKRMLGWCCEVTVSLDLAGKTADGIACQATHIVKTLDAILRKKSSTIPYPLVTGCLVEDNSIKVFWQVKTPEEVERQLSCIQTDAKMSFVLREDRFWQGYTHLLSMLKEDNSATKEE